MSITRSMSASRLVFAAAAIAAFAACDSAPKPPGTVSIDFSTSQGDENLFVWGVSLDGASPHNVNSSDTGRFILDAVSAGDHHLILSSLPPACTSGSDDRLVTVPSAETLKVSIGVVCARTTGDVGLIVATSGSDFDADGYTLLIDGSPGPTIPSAPLAGLVVPRLTPGPHEFTLTGFARNCSIAPNAAHTAVVVAGQQTPLTIGAVCTSLNGTIQVVTTTNSTPTEDPDGYLVTVGTTVTATPNSGTTDVSIKAGTYDVTLSGIEPSCSASSAKQTVTVAEVQTVTVNFNVTCGAYPAAVAGVSVADPAADTLANPTREPVPAFDILSVGTKYASTYMAITLKLSGQVATAPLRGFIDLDLDENPLTGQRPVMNDVAVGGAASQGSEKLVYFEVGNGALLFDYASQSFTDIRLIADGDSLQFFLPFEKLGDDGNLTITTVLGPILPDLSPGRPTDYAPNTGVIVSHVPAAIAIQAGQAPNPPPRNPSPVTRAKPAVWRKPPG